MRSFGATTMGFTLPEIIAVLLITGLLAATVVPRVFDRTSVDAQGFFQESLAAVRYANKLAIASGCDVQVNFNAGGFALNRRAAGCDSSDCGGGCAFGVPVDHPSRPGPFVGNAPPGVPVSNATLYFDRIGRPRDAGDNLIAVDTDITVGGVQTLRIEPETGFAHRL